MFSLLLERPPSREEPVPEREEPQIATEEEPDVEMVFTNEIRECFEIFDKTQSGTFDIKYLEKAFQSLGINMTAFEMEDVTKNLDKDGLVHFESFQQYALDKMMTADDFESVSTAFKVFDPENEGMVPTDRLKKWMTTLGNPLTEKEAKEMIKLGDPNNKGFVPYDVLVGYLVKK